jgi:hypothetical protein
MTPSKSLLAGAVVAVLAHCNAAHADTRVQASSGVQYSDGKYGETTSTSALVVPFSVRATFEPWSIRASVPYVTVDGPADVSEIIDDSSGRGSSSGSGSSGSGSGSGNGRSGRGSGSGRGGGDDNDDDGAGAGGADFAPGRSVSGIGDASVALTYSLDAIGDSPVYVDFTGRVRLPTGNEDEGLGVGATDVVSSATPTPSSASTAGKHRPAAGSTSAIPPSSAPTSIGATPPCATARIRARWKRTCRGV